MPNANIKNEGKKFSKDYQPEEKWTEEKALKLGNDLIEWLKAKNEDDEDEGNILYEEFLVVEKDLHEKTILYLKSKFKSFLPLYEKAKKIQEIKLHKYGLADKLNPNMCKFSLNVNHGWIDKKATDLTTNGKDINSTIPDDSFISAEIARQVKQKAEELNNK